MEDPNGEWEIVDYPSNDDDFSEGKMGWILNKGLGLGKKILITGFVMSSAPLVIPPLVVISAIGFVASVPSGIFLASYACTEKLMNKLLPMPYRDGEDYYIDMEKEEDEERKDIQREVKTRIELEDEKASKDENEGADYVEGVKGNAVEITIEENGHEEDVEKEKPEENSVVESKNDKKEDQSMVDERQSRKEEPVKAEEAVVLIESEADNESRVTTVEETREEGKADNQKTAQGDQSGYKTGELPVSSGAEVKDAGSTSEKGAKSAPSGEAKKKKSVKKKPQQLQEQQQKVSDIEEEKIWEQIDAVRGIVGYKATPQKTSIEEVRALYIFTGVEPPASLEEHSDLAQVDSKLQCLMSIIGVK
ncbi:uncharacterized protein LOC133790570 isoform X2 [Humulus lupulus]|uniref:uncharacterized protein LOC133790570 isoform X2 n=1 Tax=Humulus lupulus TaxID=3486 RepID=UPI002B410EB5|nr:uncharacterized protein LOC133790570 isoform X2 [Humulus lupulus]